MELEITEQNDNPLLSRQEIKVVIKHNEDSTPRRNQVIKNLAEQLKANRELSVGRQEAQLWISSFNAYLKPYGLLGCLTWLEF